MSEAGIFTHLKAILNLENARHPEDSRIERERQGDPFLEPYVDDCTKCRQDFCRLHAGDIDGLCRGCI